MLLFFQLQTNRVLLTKIHVINYWYKFSSRLHLVILSFTSLHSFILTCEYKLVLRKSTCRSSHRRSFVRKSVLRNFAKFTGRHLWQSLFFNKVTGLRPAILFKKETLAHVFSCEFCKISKNTFFTEHLWWLLLYMLHLLARDKLTLNMMLSTARLIITRLCAKLGA